MAFTIHCRRLIRPFLVLAAAVLLLPGDASAQEGEAQTQRNASTVTEAVLTVVVTDEAGEPVENAEAFIIDNTSGLPVTETWTAGTGGRISIAGDNRSRFNAEPVAGPVKLLVRAPHHAWSTQTVTLPPGDEVPVTLSPGTPVTIRLNAGQREIPADLGPLVVVPDVAAATWITCVQQHDTRWERPETAVNPAIPERVAVGEYLLRLPKDLAAFHVLIDHPGFLRCYQTDALTPPATTAAEALVIDLPASASLQVSLEPDTETRAEYDACGVSLSHRPTEPGGWSFRVVENYRDEQTLNLTLDDLAPGNYGVEAFTGTKENRGDGSRDSYFRHSEGRQLKGGETAEFAVRLRTYDEAQMREQLAGDHDVSLTVHNSDGTPAAGRPYQLVVGFHQFAKQLTITEGDIPADGVIRLGNIGQPQGGRIQLNVDGESVGGVLLSEEEEKHVAHTFNLAPSVGDAAPDITLVRLENGETFTLSSLKGQVVLVDFWASWCGPCQEPMAHNNEILARRGDSWNGKAVILGASIDQTIDIIRKHVDERGWTNVLQAWCGEGAWQSEPVKKYAVRGVPTAYLLDEEGIIRWSGHPASVDVEQKIDELLKD